MNDAISRSALINGLKSVKFPECKSMDEKVQDLYQSIKSLYNSIIKAIETEPAIDVAPVVHARWVYSDTADADNNIDAYCSHCDAGDTHSVEKMHKVPYCWYCGARMDAEEG